MATSINKTWSAVFTSITILLLAGGLCPAAFPLQPPQGGPPGMNMQDMQDMTDEERQQMIDQIRQRMQQMQQQGGMPGQRGGQNNRRGMQNGFPGQFPFPTQQQPQTQSTAPQQMSLVPEEGNFKLNFKDVDLNAFIQQVAELLSITPLVVDPNVQGTVTIYSSTPMTKTDVLTLFNMILKQKNASMLLENGIYQVVPISSALRTGVGLVVDEVPGDKEEKTVTPPSSQSPAAPQAVPPQAVPPQAVPPQADPPQADPPQAVPPGAAAPATGSSGGQKVSTHVVRVEYVPARDLIEPIKLLMTDGGVIMPYDRLNMLILTDYDSSIDRILKIIHLLDSEYMDEDLIDLIKIEHNNSADVADDLEKLFGNGAQTSSTGINFVSLDRLNSIFVIANSKRGLSEIRKWIQELDTTTGRKIQTNVYVVKNSTASNIATLLNYLYGGSTTGQNTQQGGRTTSAAFPGGSTGTGTSALGGSQSQRGSFGSFSSGNTSTLQSGGTQSMFSGTSSTTSSGLTSGQQLNPQLSSTRTISAVILQGGELSGLQDTVRLVVDDISNRLVIQSTAADYAFLLEAIELMDISPRQVVIDAQVFEVDLTDDFTFGVGAALRERSGGSTTEAGWNASTTDGTPNGSLTAYNIALVGTHQELLSAINALREKTNVRILEAPSVLAMDGTEAAITVGAEVPYPSSLYYTNNSAEPTQSVQYRDTGVTLLVQPKISASGSVTMDILQEVSGVGTTSSTYGPTFTKSRVTATLTVQDGATVAIAGLIRDSHSLTRSGFPILSDIPVVGSLFGQTNRNKKRTELIIMITPHVIKDHDEFQKFSDQFKNSLKNVRKWSDEKDQERADSLQDAAKDREKQEMKKLEEEEKIQKKKERELRRKRS